MKEHLERVFSGSYLKPAYRAKVGNDEVFLCDGFVTPEQYPALRRRFTIPIDKEEHPEGCYVTMWFIMGKVAARGGYGVFKKSSDSPEGRVQVVLDLARQELTHKQVH